MALYFRPTAALTLLLLLGTLLSSLLVAGLRALSARTLGVPVLSLPFVLATWVALLAARRFAGLEPALDPVLASGVGSGVLPAAVEHVLRSLGAAFFQLSVPSGALVAVGLVLASRWSAVLGLIGLAAGAATYAALGGRPTT